MTAQSRGKAKLDEPVLLYMVGTAGCGKTTLSSSMQYWMANAGYDAVIVNLDPGAESLPYEPDIDIRDWFTLGSVMNESGLGPNGAQILCADMLAFNINEVKKELEKIRTDYVIVDTPGQIELFAFRESSRVLTETLGDERGCLVFLLEPSLAKQPSGFVSLTMLSSTVRFRFSLPSINVLAKSDLLTEEEIDTIATWSENPNALIDALDEYIKTENETANTRYVRPAGMSVQLSIEFFKALEKVGAFGKIIPSSATELTGAEDIYNVVQQVFMGGEDLEKR